MIVEHTLKPIYNKQSETLILGSIPSVISREVNAYYGNKTNRFWKVLSIIYNEEITDKEEFILKHKLALWDTVASCEINNSCDSSIKNIKPNDIKWIISETNIKRIFLTGKKAYDIYNKYIYKDTNIKGIYLPSTSSANAKMSIQELVNEYKQIKD